MPEDLVKLFLRFDRFDRFVSALLLAPRNQIDAKLQAEIHVLLAKAFNGRASAVEAAVDDSPLVRLHYIIGRNDGPMPKVDVRALERDILALVEHELGDRLQQQAALPEPSQGRLSRQSRSFPIKPRVDLRPDERGQYYLLSLSANDRTGLTSTAEVLQRNSGLWFFDESYVISRRRE